MILSTKEAAVLNAFGEDHEAKVFELASVARLKPSEVLNILTLLAEKRLVQLDEQQANAYLTDHGIQVRGFFEEQSKQVFSSIRAGTNVDTRTGGNLQTKGGGDIEIRGGYISGHPSDELDLEQIDRDLDAEIKRLK